MPLPSTRWPYPRRRYANCQLPSPRPAAASTSGADAPSLPCSTAPTQRARSSPPGPCSLVALFRSHRLITCLGGRCDRAASSPRRRQQHLGSVTASLAIISFLNFASYSCRCPLCPAPRPKCLPETSAQHSAYLPNPGHRPVVKGTKEKNKGKALSPPLSQTPLPTPSTPPSGISAVQHAMVFPRGWCTITSARPSDAWL